MTNWLKKLFVGVLMAVSCTASVYAQPPVSFGLIRGRQPWDLGENSIQNYFQQQASAMCGQTSMYMIARYYGDVGKDNYGDYLYKVINAFGYWVTVDLDSYDDVRSYWLVYIPGGMSITRVGLYGGALDMAEAIKENNVKLYNTRYYAKDPSGTGYADGTKTTYDKTATTSAAEKFARLNYIKINYLDKGIPAVIHLDRDNNETGHYIILAGYHIEVCDADLSQCSEGAPGTLYGPVYYVNPNWGACHTQGSKLESIDIDSFLHDDWYSCGGNLAFWDGKWFVFYAQ